MPLADPTIITEPERLKILRDLNLLDTPPDPAFDRLTRIASYMLKAPVSLVSLVDVDRQFFKSQIGLPEPWATTRQTPLSHAFCQHAVATGEPLIVDDAREHPLVYDLPSVTELEIIAYAGIPLTTSEGANIGSFCVIDHQPRHWTDEDIELLEDLAASVMTEIELRAEIAERQTLITRLRELEQVKTDMIRLAAHDLRNPLSIIVSAVDLLRESDELQSQENQENITLIRDAGRRMQRIISDILSLEHIEEFSASHTTVDLVAVVQETFAARRSDADLQSLSYHLHDTVKVASVLGNKSQLREALDNLITNAIKYTPKGGDIMVSILPGTDRHVQVIVEDSGFGIPKEHQTRLFQPFYRAKIRETQDIDGTGLGLHLVSKIIQRHSGHVFYRSTYGEGSTFGFELPLTAP